MVKVRCGIFYSDGVLVRSWMQEYNYTYRGTGAAIEYSTGDKITYLSAGESNPSDGQVFSGKSGPGNTDILDFYFEYTPIRYKVVDFVW